jgi:hypothetical protein
VGLFEDDGPIKEGNYINDEIKSALNAGIAATIQLRIV